MTKPAEWCTEYCRSPELVDALEAMLAYLIDALDGEPKGSEAKKVVAQARAVLAKVKP